MTRTSIAILLLCATSACGDKDNAAADSSKPAESGKAATRTTGAKATNDAKPARKAKTTMTEKQLKEAYDSLEPVPDFKKHREMLVAKVGPPMKEDGDKAFWFGITPANGAQPEKCYQLIASPTKGNETGTVNDSNCWE